MDRGNQARSRLSTTSRPSNPTVTPTVKMLDLGIWKPIATEPSHGSMGGDPDTAARGTHVGIRNESLRGSKYSLKFRLH
jgi:hypothetical protein